ncbi:MAG: ADP-ribosylglycohydrolase family protein, partial [Clostridiales bacterium]
GQLLQVFLETVAADCQKNPQGRFMRDDYVHAVNNFFENTILPEASFDPVSGKISPLSGRYTNEEVRDNFDYWYNKGQKNGRWWYPESNTSPTSTTDIGQTGVILAALYRDPREAFYKGYELLSMWYTDKAYIASQLMYIMTVHAFINNVPIKYYENYLIALFDKIGVIETYINSFDDSMIFVDVFRMLKKEHLFKAVDDRFASILFGTNCHCFNLIPCAYYYSIKNTTNFEKGILTAVNSSGNNMSRAALTGGILGAMNGIQGIPQRFIDGLKTDKPLPENYTSYGQYLMDLAKTVAQKSNGKIPPLELSYESDCGCYVSFD